MDNCPISGKPCPYQKVIHVTDIGKDYTAEASKDMCIACGLSYLYSEESKFETPATNLLDTLNLLVKGQSTASTEEQLRCPNCGITEHEINLKGRMGCAQCYEYYKDFIKPLILRIHGGTQHVGKSPNKKALAELEEELKKAILTENYEQAKLIKEKIKELS